jgi:hypothetical protein
MNYFDYIFGDYIKGFNDASFLAEFSPNTLEEAKSNEHQENDYFSGFFDAKDYFEKEKEITIEQEMEEIEKFRELGRDEERER